MRLFFVERCHEKPILMLSLLIPSLSRDEARRTDMQLSDFLTSSLRDEWREPPVPKP